MTRLIKLLTLLFSTCSVIPAFSQFEGIIAVDKQSIHDTTRYVYYIKGELIRIEELTKLGTVKTINLVNTNTNTAQVLNPSNKQYFEIGHEEITLPKLESILVMKGDGKSISGYKCKEYVISNPEENTEITYFISKGGDFEFYPGLLRTLNRRDKIALYFHQLHIQEQEFPLEITEKDMDGNFRCGHKVTSVHKKELPLELFELPQGYRLFKGLDE